MSRNSNRLASIAAGVLPLVGLVVCAGLAMLLAYQVRPTYPVSMDRTFDRHYLTDGWHQTEVGEQFPFRWMSGYATVKFPAIGRQPLKLVMHMGTSGVDPKPEKQVRVMARGALVAVFNVRNGIARYEAPVAPELVSRATGDLDLLVTTDSFEPPGDRRQLGVIVAGLAIEPEGSAGLILPPFFHTLYVALIGLLLYAILLMLGVDRRISLGAGVAAILVMSLVYGFARPAIAFYTGDLLLAVAISFVALAIAQPLVTRLYRRAGMRDFHPRSGQGSVLFGLFAFGLVIAMSGILYPQSEPHDFGFHLHRFQEVQAGNLFFENYVVSGVGQGFYPPAMYVLLLPFSLLMRDPTNLVMLAPALFGFSAVFLIYYLARRYMSSYRYAAIFAAALYVVLPVNLLVIWWAHETNLFGMVVLLATVTCTLESYERIHKPLVWLGLATLTFVLLLSHPGVLVWSVLLLSALVAAFLALRRFAGNGTYRSVLLVAGAYATAALVAFVLYYSRYVGTFGQVALERGEEVDISETLGTIGDIGRMLAGLRLAFYHGVLGDYGLIPLLLVPVGLWLLFRKRSRHASTNEPDTDFAATEQQARRFRWTLLLWVGVAVVLQVVSLLTALPVRPFLLMWVPVALLGGLSLAAFVQVKSVTTRQWTWQKAATALVFVGLAAFSLYLWALANFLDLRIPHVYPLVF